MKKQKENMLQYNSQEELFSSLMRKHRHSLAELSAHELQMRIAKAMKQLVAAFQFFIS